MNAINAVGAADLTAAGTATFTVTVDTIGPVADVTSNFVGAGTDGTATRTTDGVDPTWGTLTIDSSAEVGQYVKMVADEADDKLYIAYYDFTNANLKLARLDWDGTGTPGGIAISTIDSNQSAGTWTNIAMVTNSSLTGQGTAQPVITYYADSYNGTKSPIRMAFPHFNAASETGMERPRTTMKGSIPAIGRS